jgi:hypothetical protein
MLSAYNCNQRIVKELVRNRLACVAIANWFRPSVLYLVCKKIKSGATQITPSSSPFLLPIQPFQQPLQQPFQQSFSLTPTTYFRFYRAVFSLAARYSVSAIPLESWLTEANMIRRDELITVAIPTGESYLQFCCSAALLHRFQYVSHRDPDSPAEEELPKICLGSLEPI